MTIYREIGAAAANIQDGRDVSVPDVISVLSCSVPAQLRTIDASKIRWEESIATMVKRLKDTQSRGGASTSKD